MFFMLTLRSTKKFRVAQNTVVSTKKYLVIYRRYKNIEVNVAHQNYVSQKKCAVATKKIK